MSAKPVGGVPSSWQRVSATPEPVPSSALMFAWTLVVYQPPAPFGVGGTSAIVVTGAVLSITTVSAKVAVASANSPFEAVTGNVYVPGAVGVPDSTPAALSERPGGGSGARAETAPSGVPVVDENVCEYGALTRAGGGGEGAGAGGCTPRCPSVLLPQHAP